MFADQPLRTGTVSIRRRNAIQRTACAYTALHIFYIPCRIPFEHFALCCITLMQASLNGLQNKSQQA